jgi:hypothetical protein
MVSKLLTCGVNLAYVSRQLGHADIQVTTRHYARWCGGDEYREPMRLDAGEVPTDLLARIAPELTPVSPHLAERETAESANPRPFLGNLERETGFEPATLSLGS